MFDIKMVTTDKNNRRSGLGTDLLRRSVQLAGSLGYKVRTEGGREGKLRLTYLDFTDNRITTIKQVHLYNNYNSENQQTRIKIRNVYYC